MTLRNELNPGESEPTIRVHPGPISLKEIAGAAGVSKATVSRALRGDPAVKLETRDRILAAAKKFGYASNPYVGRVMSKMRRQQSKTFRGNLGLIWPAQIPGPRADRRLLIIQSSVRQRADELGYTINEFSSAERSPESLMQLLWHQGIQGVLIAAPSFHTCKAYVRFNLKEFCCVVLGSGLIHPPLHTVRFDYFQAMRIALHHARHTFGSGIAAVWDGQTNRRSNHSSRASFIINHPGGVSLGAELFLDQNTLTLKMLRLLVKRYKIQCLICESAVVLPEGAEDLVPPENFITFKRPRGKSFFGWIDTRNELLGSWAVEMLANKLGQWETGLPEACETLLVPPRWFRAGAGKSDEIEIAAPA